jgi:hypothetical protein
VKSFFQKGFDAVNKMSEEAKANSGKTGIYDFYVKDGEEKLMRFLTDEPLSFYAHTIKVGTVPRVFVCTGEPDCKGCQQPDSFDASKLNKRSIKSAFLVLDGTVTTKDEVVNGAPTGKVIEYTDQVRVMVRGTSDVAAIQRNKEKYGLLDRAYYVSKNGKKNPYNFDRVDDCPAGKDPLYWSKAPLTEEAKEKIIESLPEKYKEIAKTEGFMGVLQSLFVPYGETEVEEPKEVQQATGLKRL